MASDISLTLPNQDDEIVPGVLLTSRTSTYKVQSVVGQGTFGTVTKCLRMHDMKTVAIKMMKNEDYLIEQANAEVAALSELRALNPDECNFVQWYQAFTDRGYNCLEFEHLDKSLLDFVHERCSGRLHLEEVRPIVQQVTTALGHLKSVGIIHSDLKLENVMLVDHQRQPYRVKVIDFGLAQKVSSIELGYCLQTRPYRSPEIMLGLPFTEAIDMWSLGCLAAELYLGVLLYPGMNEYDMMRYIVETQGQPPDKLLDSGLYTSSYFQRNHSFASSHWRLKTPGEFFIETGIRSRDTTRIKLASLDDLLHILVFNHNNSDDRTAELCNLKNFVDLLKEMLQLDAAKRITPHQVLEHDFIKLHHTANIYSPSSHFFSCLKPIDDCQKDPTDSRTAECSSPQPSSSTTIHPVQPNLPSPAADRSSQKSRSGIKRKPDDDEGTMPDVRFEPGCDSQHRKKHADLSSFVNTEACTTVGTHPVLQQDVSLYPTKPSIKRKMADKDDVEHRKTASYHSSDFERSYKRARSSCGGSSMHNSVPTHDSIPSQYCLTADHQHYTMAWSQAQSGTKRKRIDSEDVCHNRKRSALCLEDGESSRGCYSGQRKTKKQRQRQYHCQEARSI